MKKGEKWSPEIREKMMSHIKSRNYSGANNPHWRGGRVSRKDGRVMIYDPDNPNANLYGGTHILEYRLIAEKKIGRHLKKDEIVHHINGDVLDNRPENLDVMTQSEHAKIECESRRDQATGRFVSPRRNV